MKKQINKYLIIAFFSLAAAGAVFAAGAVEDPAEIGIGAKPLGLGGAYVAIASDANAIFINPAGLSKARSLQFTSMYSSVLGDINYTTIGVDYPLPGGTLGIGYVASSIGQIPAAELDADGRPDPLTEDYFDYTNSVIYLSAGTSVQKYIDTDYDIDIGASLKFFRKGFSGAFSGAGHGYDIDLGILYRPYPYLALGLCQTNILPMSMGGKLTWGNDVEESIPSVTKLGLALQTQDNLTLSIELRRRLAGAEYPSTSHFGFDWRVNKNLSLRLGFDQSVDARRDIYSNYIFGVGLHSFDWHLDYAYHPYFEFGDTLTHYASLSYYEEEKILPPVRLIEIDSPADMSVTFEDAVMVSGRVEGIRQVRVNEEEVFLAEDGSFALAVPLLQVKNAIVLDFVDREDKTESHKLRVLKKTGFPDLAEEHFAFDDITSLATLGIIKGFPDGEFKAERELTRAEFATLLAANFDEIEDIPPPDLTDINEKQWFYKNIKIAAQRGFMKGYPDKTFRANNPITRAEAVLTLVDFDKWEKGAVEAPVFDDVAPSHWAAGAIKTAKQENMLFPLEGEKFEPNKRINRGQTSYSLARTNFGKKLIGELYNWEAGY